MKSFARFGLPPGLPLWPGENVMLVLKPFGFGFPQNRQHPSRPYIGRRLHAPSLLERGVQFAHELRDMHTGRPRRTRHHFLPPLPFLGLQATGGGLQMRSAPQASDPGAQIGRMNVMTVMGLPEAGVKRLCVVLRESADGWR